MKIKFLLLALYCSLLLSCTKNKTNIIQDAARSEKNNALEFYGLLKKLEVSSFMYGTHYIKNGNKFYALKSSTINLDAYVEKNVTISGTKINGYPIEGGPEFIDVKTVR